MTDLTRLEPEVRTLARPTSGPLLAARGVVQRDADIQVAFVKAKAEGWDAARLVEAIEPLLQNTLDTTPEQVHEVALYLADEYLQDGDGILIVSRETGKALARLTEEDLWQPSPVRREDGSLAQPLPRIRPDLEGFLVEWTFDRAREEKARRGLSASASKQLAAQQVTREGRRGLTHRLQEEAPHFLAGLRGAAQSFLQSFEVVEADVVAGAGLVALPRVTAYARTRTPIVDLAAFNFRFDIMSSQRSLLAAGWVNEMARNLAASCPTVQPLPVDDLPGQLAGSSFGVAPPDAVETFRKARVQALFADTTRVLALRGQVGIIQIHPDSYRIGSREVFDRWEVGGSVEFTLWVDWDRIRAFAVDFPATVQLVG